jgi:hypothetical protein
VAKLFYSVLQGKQINEKRKSYNQTQGDEKIPCSRKSSSTIETENLFLNLNYFLCP